jgi:hypothetical protein
MFKSDTTAAADYENTQPLDFGARCTVYQDLLAVLQTLHKLVIRIRKKVP